MSSGRGRRERTDAAFVASSTRHAGHVTARLKQDEVEKERAPCVHAFHAFETKRSFEAHAAGIKAKLPLSLPKTSSGNRSAPGISGSNSLFLRRNSLFSLKDSLFHRVGNFDASH